MYLLLYGHGMDCITKTVISWWRNKARGGSGYANEQFISQRDSKK